MYLASFCISIPFEIHAFLLKFLIIKTTENFKLVLYNDKVFFLPAHFLAILSSSLVEVNADNNIILPFALSYGNKLL